MTFPKDGGRGVEIFNGGIFWNCVPEILCLQDVTCFFRVYDKCHSKG